MKEKTKYQIVPLGMLILIILIIMLISILMSSCSYQDPLFKHNPNDKVCHYSDLERVYYLNKNNKLRYIINYTGDSIAPGTFIIENKEFVGGIYP